VKRIGMGRHGLARRLRVERPQPSEELMRSIARRVEVTRPTNVPRLALAAGLSGVMLVALASVGGIGYAANAAKQAVKVVQKAVAPTGVVSVEGISAGGDQYKPGYGWGDKNHKHDGPPGLNRRGGEAAPPLKSRRTGDGKARIVPFTITLSEQAALRIHVLDPDGNPLLLTQKGSQVATGASARQLDGKQTKVIRYTVLVPRELTISLRIPANLVKPGRQYTIRVIATDPDGNRSELLIPFVG